MKIIFEEERINTAIMALNQLKVEGIQQAAILVSINNILREGTPLEEKTGKEEKEES